MIVLKIILMILGILLGILLLLLLAVLFVPIRYKAAGEVLEDTSVKAKVTWLLSAVGVHVSYDKEQDLKVWLRILFWKKMLYEGEGSEAAEEVLESESFHEAEDAIADEATKDAENDQTESEQTENNRKTTEDIDVKSGQDKELSGEVESFSDGSEDTDSEDSQSASNKKSHKKVKKDASDEERTSDKNRKEKPGENIRRMIDWIKAFHYDDRDKAALSHIKDELIKLLKHLCPTKSRLNLKYSTGSPDTTGISLGVIAMFPIAYKNKWNIVPDFEAEEAYGKGSGWLKGRIYVYYLLVILLRLYRDKNCYRLYRKIKRF